MTRIVAATAVTATVALLVAAGALGRASSPPTLHGTVGPGFTITLTKGGKKVTKLRAGSYRFVVADRASIHNFVLEKARGGTFERAITSVPFIGTKALTVKLTPGRWEYYCRPHESTMHGDFTVT